MEQAPCISQIASLLADPKRTAMLWALMDGSSKSSAELAALAELSPASANAHLARLTSSGLLRVEARRGTRVFRMAVASTTLASAVRSAPNATAVALVAPPQLRRARLCQGHLGGELAAGLYQRMMAAGWVERCDPRIDVTPKGARQLANLGIFTQALASPVACDCSDWSQQQPHLGGALGAGLLQLFLQLNWVSIHNESRALLVSDTGLEEISRLAASDAP